MQQQWILSWLHPPALLQGTQAPLLRKALWLLCRGVAAGLGGQAPPWLVRLGLAPGQEQLALVLVVAQQQQAQALTV